MLKSYDKQPKKEIKKMDSVDDDEKALERRLTSEVVNTLKELRKAVENKLVQDKYPVEKRRNPIHFLKRITIAIKMNEFKLFVEKLNTILELFYDHLDQNHYIPIAITEMFTPQVNDSVMILFKKENTNPKLEYVIRDLECDGSDP